MGQTGRKPTIYLHADDYGMTYEMSERILKCCREGAINSVGIVPNGCVEEAIQLLSGIPGVPCAIHINLVEGRALSTPEKADLLVHKDGYMKHTFFGLFFLSISPFRRRLAAQAYEEMKQQILQMKQMLPENMPLYIDSHQHVHMIPLLFRTLVNVIEDCGFSVRRIRIPAEPVIPFLREPELYKTYSLMNVVKNVTLNIMWQIDKPVFARLKVDRVLFCGLIFSGKMDERVLKIFPHFYHLACKKGYDLEFVFHPGYLEKQEQPMDPYKESFEKFYRSSERKAENRFLCSGKIQKEIKSK